MPSNFHIHCRQWSMRRTSCRELGSFLKFGFELEQEIRGTRLVDLRPRSVQNYIVSQSGVQCMHFQDCTSNVTMKAILCVPILSCYAYSSGLSAFPSNLMPYLNSFQCSHSPCAAIEVFFQVSFAMPLINQGTLASQDYRLQSLLVQPGLPGMSRNLLLLGVMPVFAQVCIFQSASCQLHSAS